LRSRVSTCTRDSASLIRAATGVPSVGTLWSAVASVRSGRRTLRPASRRPSNGLRARHLVHQVQVDEQQPGATSWASQILSSSVFGMGSS
jgi:hypothetical protein